MLLFPLTAFGIRGCLNCTANTFSVLGATISMPSPVQIQTPVPELAKPESEEIRLLNIIVKALGRIIELLEKLIVN